MFGIKKKLYSNSIINVDTKFKGNIITSGDILIDGEIDGNIECKELTIGINGVINGTVTAEKVNIFGMIKGDIYASSVLFNKTARVKGDIYHKYVSIATGASIAGDFKHLSEAQSNTNTKKDK